MEGKRDYSNNKYSPRVILKVSDRQGRYLFVKESSGKFGLPKECIYPEEFMDSVSLYEKAHKIANDLGFKVLIKSTPKKVNHLESNNFVFHIVTNCAFKTKNQECKWLDKKSYNNEILNGTKFNMSTFFF